MMAARSFTSSASGLLKSMSLVIASHSALAPLGILDRREVVGCEVGLAREQLTQISSAGVVLRQARCAGQEVPADAYERAAVRPADHPRA
jgi:hypothetical protein